MVIHVEPYIQTMVIHVEPYIQTNDLFEIEGVSQNSDTSL